MIRLMKLAGNDFKTAIINVFKDIKEKIVILSKQMGNLSIEIGRKEEGM